MAGLGFGVFVLFSGNDGVIFKPVAATTSQTLTIGFKNVFQHPLIHESVSLTNPGGEFEA